MQTVGRAVSREARQASPPTTAADPADLVEDETFCRVCYNSGEIVRTDGLERSKVLLTGLPCLRCHPEDFNPAFEARRQERLDESLQRARLPVKYHHKTLDDFVDDPTRLSHVRFAPVVARRMRDGRDRFTREEIQRIGEWKEKLEGYIANLQENLNNGIGVTIWGATGSGKTLTFSIVANAIVKAGHSVAFVPEETVLGALRGTYDDASLVSENEMLDTLRSVKALMIDDLGIRATEWSTSKYHALIDPRYDAGLPTFACTNLEPDRLAKVYPRLSSRLARNIEIAMNGPDLRGSELDV